MADDPIADELQPSESTPPAEPGVRWLTRALALFVDVAPATAVLTVAVLTALALPLRSPWWWLTVSVAVAAASVALVNRVVLPANGRQSPGRALTGTRVVRSDGDDPGFARLALREAAHLLDTLSVFVGWLWPLWDHRGRTFADMVAGTEVARIPEAGEAGRRGSASRLRPVTLAFLSAALGCVALATIGLGVVYQRDRATADAQAAIDADGPRIIEDLLSYNPASMREDFAQARSLATDRYRELLIPHQEAIEHSDKVVVNEYWVNNIAVLTAAPRQVTTLAFVQGQRGEGAASRLITATLRVTFVKSHARWLVDDLSVVFKPPEEPK